MEEENSKEAQTSLKRNEPIPYLLKLLDNGQPNIPKDHTITCEKNTVLQLEMFNGGPFTQGIHLITNASLNFSTELLDKAKSSIATEYDQLTNYFITSKEVSTSLLWEINLTRAGPITFLFLYQDEITKENKLSSEFYIIVDPNIRIKNYTITIRELQLQTILSKSIGKINDFKKMFKEMKQLNFNFVHFTPIQKLGVSESLYCLRDNTQINNIFFDNDKVDNEEKLLQFKTALDSLRNDYGIGSIVDIVLNHAADNSEWLDEHPDCGYNLVNCPWLTSAYELDRVYADFSTRFGNCKTRFKCAPFVNNEQELNDIMGDISKEINEKNLHEYFMINIPEAKNQLSQQYSTLSASKDQYNEIIGRNSFKNVNNEKSAFDYINSHCLDNYGEERNGVTLKHSEVCCALMKISKDKNEFLAKADKCLNQINNTWGNNIKSFISTGLNNVRNGIKFQFIECKSNASKIPLIWPYFAVFDKNDKRKILACNGWIMESEDKNDPTPIFTKKGSYYYFKRKVMIWSDCPKLNYGSSISTCCPYLLEHMTKYVQDMARIFNGFRLDNAHSTPIYIAEYLAQKAREVNPDLLVIAELFTTKENEIKFVNRIGINLLIRELIWCSNSSELAEKLHRFGGGNEEVLGKMEDNIYDYSKENGTAKSSQKKLIISHLPSSMIFDLTHDNETYHQKFKNLSLNLTKMACNSLCSCSIGSTRGVDQLFPIQASVVNESRLYQYDDQFDKLCDAEPNMEQKTKQELTQPKEETDEIKDIKVIFEFKASNAQSVALSISSNNWKPDIYLEKSGNDYYRKEITLPKGKYYYKYVINNSNWVHDQSKPNEKDSSGNINNVIEVQAGRAVQAFITSSNKQSYHVADLKLLRKQLNSIRNELASNPNEFFLHRDGHYLAIFRSFKTDLTILRKNTLSCDGFVMVCRTGYDSNNSQPTRIEIPGIYSEFVCGSSMKCGNINIDQFKSNSILSGTKSDVYLTKDSSYLNSFCKILTTNNKSILEIGANMQPNSVIILKYKLPSNVKGSLLKIEESLSFLHEKGEELLPKITMCDINLILYKCETEELENTGKKRGNYQIKNWKTFTYAGLAHLHQVLQQLKASRDNHPILDNIREGDWLLQYSLDRFCDQVNLKEFYSFLKQNIFEKYQCLYIHHKPYYFTRIIDAIYHLIERKISQLTNESLVQFSLFSRKLIKAIFQFNGYVESSRFKHNFYDSELNKMSMSAGLPHFSTEYMRCWGRDTFIAFKGLMLIPGYFREAKEILMSFASTMRHGLIPNLLDNGVNCRYNARDATWFWLQSVADYVDLSGNNSILNDDVSLIFLDDDYNTHQSKAAKGERRKMKLYDVVQNILQLHVKGISFREWRAGKAIDEQMKDEGFNINIYFNESTGFIYGGNKWNCGTWMDKMGSSEKAKNKGTPATPRNGADVEIIGLLYSVLRFLIKMNKEAKYQFSSVRLNNGSELTFEKWSNLLKENFDKHFFIESRNEFTNKVSIYRDYLSDDNDKRHECQLRPNFFVTMAVSPELFDKSHALKAIEVAEKYLCVNNCVGIRTLDYEDKNYNGNYILSDDGTNFQSAHGFNYHNGPEWVWPIGYYFVSKMNFAPSDSRQFEDLLHDICKKLIPFMKYISEDQWSGLPELTNKDGTLCPGSCTTQAWSIGTIIEAINKLKDLMAKKAE